MIRISSIRLCYDISLVYVIMTSSFNDILSAGYPSTVPRANQCPFPEGPRQTGSYSRNVFRARWMLAELMTRLVLPGRLEAGVGSDSNSLRGLFHRCIVGKFAELEKAEGPLYFPMQVLTPSLSFPALCRLPCFNSAVRGPNSAPRSQMEEGINMSSLVDRPLLEDFVLRMATLGA